MLELDAYRVEGLRALFATADIPVRSPTILTGGNDGGKTTALHALEFLLGRRIPTRDDFTVLGPPEEGATEPLRSERVTVIGRFIVDEMSKEELGLVADAIELRRSMDADRKPAYEALADVPADPRLRNLEALKLQELQEVCGELSLQPTGKKNSRASWLDPLNQLAAEGERTWAWTPCADQIIQALPQCLVFSSIDEPRPDSQIREALRVAYDQALDSEEYSGPLRDAERKMRCLLQEEAKGLCSHIENRCPELSGISIDPKVAFRESFSGVEVRTSKGAVAGIPLEQSGAGRRRQVNLAIWEWVEELLEASPDNERGIVIAYDEPDTHLDYGHQRDLVNLIRTQCARRGTRMLIATHSLNLIDRVSINDVVHLRLESDRTQVERLMGREHADTQRYLADVSAAMGLRNSVLLHERCFVGVEGPTETQAFPLLFSVACGLSLQSAGIALIAGNGNEGALRFAQFLKEHDRRLAFVVDRDSSSGDSRRLFRKDKLEEVGIPEEAVHYVGAMEVEDLFDDEQWVATANMHWPRDDGTDWTVEHMGPVRLGSKFSAALMNVMRGGSEKAPERKPGYLVALAGMLRTPEEVPNELREVFASLIQLAEEA